MNICAKDGCGCREANVNAGRVSQEARAGTVLVSHRSMTPESRATSKQCCDAPMAIIGSLEGSWPRTSAIASAVWSLGGSSM